MSKAFTARASASGFIVFGVLYSPILILSILGLANGTLRGQEYVILVPLSLLVPTYAWLLGFMIRITPDRFAYRDGLWRWHACPLCMVSGAEVRWIEFHNLGRTLKFPRLVIDRRDYPQDPIVVNPKPFSRKALKRVRGLLDR